MIVKSHAADPTVFREIINGDFVQRPGEKFFFQSRLQRQFRCIGHSLSSTVLSLFSVILLYDNSLKMGKLTFYKKTLAFCKIPWYYLTCVSGCGSAWLERRLREAEVASSNPATPIQKSVEVLSI